MKFTKLTCITTRLTSLIFFTFALSACGGGGTTSNPPASSPVTPTNSAPTATAGVDLNANEQAIVSLTGSATDSDGSIVSYVWAQTSGTSVTLVDDTVATTSFSAPTITNDETLTFTLTVTDNDGAIAEDSLSVSLTNLLFVEEVDFADANLAACAIDTATTNNWPTADSITELNCDGKNISNLSNLHRLGALTALSLQDNQLEDISPLTSLTRLIGLSLGKNKISDINALANLTTLSSLGLNDNQISDISPLSNLSELTVLTLENNQIEDISALIELPRLSQVNLGENTELSCEQIDELVETLGEDAVNRPENCLAPASPPTANAGDDQSVNEQSQVTLSASGDDADGTLTGFQWVQMSGTAVTLNNADTVTASFIAPTLIFSETLIFSFEITDNSGQTASDSISVKVIPVNLPPAAEAGSNQVVNEQTQVTLSASGQDTDGTITGYNWTQVNGTTVTLNNANSASASFASGDISKDETLTFQLTVTDNEGSSATDTVNITVVQVVLAPTAHAGNAQTVSEQTQVTLAGSGTDTDGDIVAYQWLQTHGTAVSLTNANSDTSRFMSPDVSSDETLTFELKVTDNDNATSTATVSVKISQTIIAPTLNAGSDINTDELTQVTLNGSATDSDGTISSYLWTQVGSTNVTINNADSATATFKAPDISADETLTFALTVTDNDGATATDTVVITVNQVILAPVVNASADQNTNELTQVTLSGSATDSDGTISSYLWEQVGNSNVTINNATSATATFKAPDISANETLSFSLTVTDNDGATATDTVVINVNQVILAPIADAGEPQQVDELTTVRLIGSGTDTDGSIASYRWLQTQGTSVRLTNASSATATFTTPALAADQTLIFQLTVTDNDGATAVDSVSVTATATRLIAGLSFTDDNLSACVESNASVNNWTRIKEMTSLDCPVKHIASLDGIERLTGLTHLNLAANDQVDDLSPLSSLTNITSLDLRGTLGGNFIVDLSPLVALTQLTKLDLGSFDIGPAGPIVNNITDISLLANFPQLTDLSLEVNHISDLSVLANLTSLVKLNLANNAIGDISVLNSLVKLTTLNLGNNQVSDITALQNLIALTSLDLTSNQISDITVLENLTALHEIMLSKNNINDISALFKLRAATNIDLKGNDNISCADINSLIVLLSDDIVLQPDSCKVTDQLLISDISFADANLKNCVMANASNHNWVNVSDMTSLDCQSQAISQLSNIQSLTALNAVNFQSNQLTNVSLLSNLIHLNTLNLSGNQIINIDGLTGLTGLTSIDLSGNDTLSCADLDALDTALPQNALTRPQSCETVILISELTFAEDALRQCILSSADSHGWTEANEVTIVSCSHNAITDLSGIEALTRVTTMYMSHNQISDISPLAGLKLLKKLDLKANQISDVAPGGATLIDFSHVEEIDLSENNLTSVRTLARFDLTGLKVLDIKDNQLTNLTGLEALSALEKLNLRNNQLSDISAIAGLTTLQELSMELNQITDISPLSGLTAIHTAVFYRNQISDISPLANLKSLTYIDMLSNQLVDVFGGKTQSFDFSHVSVLRMHENQLTDISALSRGNFSQLYYLDLSTNQITNIDALYNLPLLRDLALIGNDNISCTALTKLTDTHVSLVNFSGPGSCLP